MPPVPLQRLGDDLRHPLESARHAGDTATRGTSGGRVRGGAFGLGDQIPGRWGTRQSGHQGLSPRLEHRCIRCLAIPTVAHQGHTTSVGHQPFSHGLLHVWPLVCGVCGIAMGEVKGVLGTLRDSVATAGQAGRVQMMEAWLTAFLGPDRQSHRAQPQITPLGMDGLERPATRQAMEHLRSDPRTTQPIERFVGTTLGRERPRSMGTPQALADHPGHRCARGDRLWRIRREARVEHPYQAQVFYHTGHKPQMIHTFHMDRCHFYPSPESSWVLCRSMQRKVKDFFSFFTCSMSAPQEDYFDK